MVYLPPATAPRKPFRNLQGHPMLAIFVALGTVFTIFIISTSYSQIIKLFPHGGGGYLVGSKLLSPTMSEWSRAAHLIIDYVLTITISVSSGTDALFSFLPESMQIHKLRYCHWRSLHFLSLLNLRGVKESVDVSDAHLRDIHCFPCVCHNSMPL